MGSWFRSRVKPLRRHLLLQQLEDRIVLDASVNPVQQDNQVSTDNVGGADPVDNAAGNVTVATGDGVEGGYQASPSGESLSQVVGQNRDEVLMANSSDQIESVQANCVRLPNDSGTLNVVLMSNAINDLECIKTAVTADTHILTYDAQHDSLSDIEARLNDLVITAGQQIDHLAILSHGDPGLLNLTSTELFTAVSMVSNPGQWQELGNLLSAEARIDFYGCDIGQGMVGSLFVNAVAQTTGVTVWASDDTTGNISGADWELEVQSAASTIPYLIDGSMLSGKDIWLDSSPIAVSQSVSVNEDGTLTITVQGLDADDPDVSAVTFQLTSPVTHGTVSASGPAVHDSPGNFSQQFLYTPSLNYYGSDSFQFTFSESMPTGAEMVKNFSADMSSTSGWPMANVNGTLFFRDSDGVNGQELWKSDGTPGGTVMVKDINADAGGSDIYYLTNVNGTLFFMANDGVNGFELWKSNGTADSTVMVKNINPGSASANPSDLTNVNGTLFFRANDGVNGFELWKSDGTSGGTTVVKDIYLGADTSDAHSLTNVNGMLFFTARTSANGYELWKSDGTANGTVMVKDINLGSGSGTYYSELINVNGTLFFRAGYGVDGGELWRSDGTSDGTVLVKDINPGSSGSNPTLFANANGTLFFRANDGVHGEELWKTDGTEAGTVMVKDINPVSASIVRLTNVDSTLFFNANDGIHGNALWRSDGTESGTVMVKSGFSSALWPVPVNGKLFFTASDGVNGTELWRSDGTEVGTVMVQDISPGPGSTNFHNYPTSVNGTLFFYVNDGDLWKSQDSLDSQPASVSITVNPVNDRPVIQYNGGPQIADAGVPHFFGVATGNPISVDEVDAGESLLTVQMYTTYGTLTLASTDGNFVGITFLPGGGDGTADGSMVFQGTEANVNAALNDLKFVGIAGAKEAAFQIRVTDAEGLSAENQTVTVWIGGEQGYYATEHYLFVPDDGWEWVIAHDPTKLAEVAESAFQAANRVIGADGAGGRIHVKIHDSGNHFPSAIVEDSGYGLDSDHFYFLYTHVYIGVDKVDMPGLENESFFDRFFKEFGSTLAHETSHALFMGETTFNPLRLSWDLSFLDDMNVKALNEALAYYVGDKEFADGSVCWPENDDYSYIVNYPTYRSYIDDILYDEAQEPKSRLAELSWEWAERNYFSGDRAVIPVLRAIGYFLVDGMDGDGDPNNHINYDNIHELIDYLGEHLWSPASEGYEAVYGFSQEALESLYHDFWYNPAFSGPDVSYPLAGLDPDRIEQMGRQIIETTSALNSGGTTFYPAADVGQTSPWHGSCPSSFTEFEGGLYFTSSDLTSGSEIWKTDGTAGSTVLFKDINPGPFSAYPTWYTVGGNYMYFVADDGEHGTELWKTDGTPQGTVMLKDIAPEWGSNPTDLTFMGSTLYFTADDGIHGRELWKTDGTATGTVMIKDIFNGENSGFGWDSQAELTAVNGVLYFVANNGVHGKELWKSDGTETGTVIVKDVWVGDQWSNGCLGNLTNVNGTLYFVGENEIYAPGLWKTDGTEAGTKWVRSDLLPNELTDVNGTLFFTAYSFDGTSGRELWKCVNSGVADNPATINIDESVTCSMVRDIFSGPAGAFSEDTLGGLKSVNGTLYFSADGGTHGTELWKSDGTAAGTVMVKDLTGNADSSYISGFTAIGSTVYFVADDGTHGWELWKTNGNPDDPNGTVMVKDINPGADNGLSSNETLTAFNGSLFFSADDGTNGRELWTSDGTSGGTVLLKEIFPASSIPRSFTDLNGVLLFVAEDDTHGTELWKTDAGGGTSLVVDISPDVDDRGPSDLINVNGTVYFTADNGASGRELWKTNGTQAGTSMLEIRSGAEGAFSSEETGTLTNVNGVLFFVADDGTAGPELWRLNPSTGLPELVKNIHADPSPAGNAPYLLTAVGNTLHFVADDGLHGYELWKSDGTSGGTVMVQDLTPGADEQGAPKNTHFGEMVNANGTLFFVADGGAKGYELWRINALGSPELVKDIWAGNDASGLPNSSIPVELTKIGGVLYFSAADGTNGRELWKTNGTEGGTVLVSDIAAGAIDSGPAGLTEFNGHLYFSANDSISGYELWKSDGTPAGTVMVKDIYSGVESSYPYGMTAFGNKLYFGARDAAHGFELWATDGTATGTAMVQDFSPGLGNGLPSGFHVLNDLLYFDAWEPTTGYELWSHDGNTAPIITGAHATLSFSGSHPNWVFDVDAYPPSYKVAVTLNVTCGSLSLSQLDGLTFIQNDGTSDATMMFTGTIRDVNEELQGLNFTPNGDHHGSDAKLTILVNDFDSARVMDNFQDFASQIYSQFAAYKYHIHHFTRMDGVIEGEGIIAIDVPSVNNAPVNAVPGTQTTDEDTSLTFSSSNPIPNGLLISDVDAGPNPVKVTLTAVNGTMTLVGDIVPLTFSLGDGTADAFMSFTGKVPDINRALEGMRFDPTPGFNGDATIKIVTSDQGNSGWGGSRSSTDTVGIVVSAVNDAPALSPGFLARLDPVMDYDTAPAGTCVSDILGSAENTAFSDLDGDSRPGIAVTHVDNSKGLWQFSLTGGLSWSDFGDPTDIQARLLPADALTMIRFVPQYGMVGTIVDGITFRAWDQTTGLAGGVVDTTTNGGSTAFSANTLNASIEVMSIDEP